MNISFSILDSEVDIIAEQYGYDSKNSNLTKDEFVLEKFKEFGRTCILSKKFQEASVTEENAKNASLEAAKSAISF